MGRRLCIVGATGAVGTEFIRVLERFRPDFSSLDLVASARSAGKRISVLGIEYVVKDIERYDFARADVAFFSAGSSVSKSHDCLLLKIGVYLGSREYVSRIE